jgi:hypothetical protein
MKYALTLIVVFLLATGAGAAETASHPATKFLPGAGAVARKGDGCPAQGAPTQPTAGCGRNGIGSDSIGCVLGSSNYPSCAGALPCAFYVAPSGGSDRNPGTSAAPFATLMHLQSVLERQVGSKKVGCLKAGSRGSYDLSTTMTFSSTDSGETWQFDPASGSNTAVLDGGGTAIPIALNGVSNFTWNGIKIQDCGNDCIYTPSNAPMTSVVVENSEVTVSTGNCTPCGLVVIDNCTRCEYKNNYFHDSNSFGTLLMAYNAGDSIDGSVIIGNVYLNVCRQQSDCGALYTSMFGSGNSGGRVTITNNFIRDQGGASLTNDVVGIYLDDKSSHVTVSGNIIGPPCVGCISSRNRNNTSAIVMNDDGSGAYNAANIVTGNVIDLGKSSMVMAAILGGSNNSFIGNIVLSNFSGPLNTCSGSRCGYLYIVDSGTMGLKLSENVYINYAPRGGAFSNGNLQSDSAPHMPPSAEFACSRPDYPFASKYTAFGSVTFAPIVGGWGPLGGPNRFILPTSTNFSC